MSTLRLESDHCGGLGGDSPAVSVGEAVAGCDRAAAGPVSNTVANALRSGAPPRYERAPVTTSACALVEPAVRALLGQFPTMPATVIAQRVGWTGGHSWFAENVARIRPEYAPADPCDRLVHLPGEQVQCDLWFPGQLVPDHAGVLRSFPVLVMVAAYSRFIAAVMIPSRVTGDMLAGMWQLISECIGGVPRTLLWDNESGIGQRGRLAVGVAGFCGVLGTRLIQAHPTIRKPKVWWSGPTAISDRRFCRDAPSAHRLTSTPSCWRG